MMRHLPALFATAATTVLALALVTSRFGAQSGMTFTLPRITYYIPNQTLGYAVAGFFCLFAFLYSMWMVPWSAQAGMWHFGLSVLCVGLFVAASIGMTRVPVFDQQSRLALPLIIVSSVAPVLFLLVQGVYLLDALRRCLPIFLRG